ncbi:hypothetical protein BN874_3020003 [Candidatus Contendobacter odensis Run_B_J11]|uniref:Uncharacterized protein n=1 Tax=Candidatus Contendobacter odensis Run_B_J11 TaxID=1400861 RepID=A0A7U7GCL2_9GAMM|nr:hypothetical protein BN874_3020003 [Candidatus Contendobacter odensis Run_B_J11]
MVEHYHHLGLRERILTLPIRVARVLSLIWRQCAGVSELVRVAQQEALLWAPPLRRLSQQALAQRLRTLPSDLFFAPVACFVGGVPGALGDPAAPLATGHRMGTDPLHSAVGGGWIDAGCPPAQSRVAAARRDASTGRPDDRLVGVDLSAALAAVV